MNTKTYKFLLRCMAWSTLINSLFVFMLDEVDYAIYALLISFLCFKYGYDGGQNER